jgi:hypothetical protein
MSQIWGNCAETKPVVEVGISHEPFLSRSVNTFDAQRGHSVNSYRALIDTGADGLSVTETVAQVCRLQNLGKRQVVGVGGVNFHHCWAAHLSFLVRTETEFDGQTDHSQSWHLFPDMLPAIQIPPNHWFDVIIGMSVLLRYDFHLYRGGRFVLDLGHS